MGVVDIRRVFVIVLDSLGIGELPDADLFNDKGSNTLKSLFNTNRLFIPNLDKLGLTHIEGNDYFSSSTGNVASIARMSEKSAGKDTTVGHWEIMGIISERPFPTFPNGFPDEIINIFEKKTGKKVLCNKAYSGTQVLLDYGQLHEKNGDLIVYTSADSVFQIAAKEDIIPVEKLYDYCMTAREILKGKYAVGRVIARPFTGTYPCYTRTANRHDFSVKPPKESALDHLKNSGYDVISVGKINDIFCGQGITESIHTESNKDGMKKTSEITQKDFNGLCFVNLVDFDSKYGHRNDTNGYVKALNDFDQWLGTFLPCLKDDDALIITADHGCDPNTESTDHSREYTPMICYGKKIKPVNLGTRDSFSDIGKTILEMFGVKNDLYGNSFYYQIRNDSQ